MKTDNFDSKTAKKERNGKIDGVFFWYHIWQLPVIYYCYWAANGECTFFCVRVTAKNAKIIEIEIFFERIFWLGIFNLEITALEAVMKIVTDRELNFTVKQIQKWINQSKLASVWITEQNQSFDIKNLLQYYSSCTTQGRFVSRTTFSDIFMRTIKKIQHKSATF